MGKRWSAGALEDDTGAPILRVPSLQALALERIRDAILEGRLPPGTPLRINALAAELGMSPIPVREALQVLATEGLAVHLPHRGMTVSPLRAEDVAQTYEVRAVLEGLAARHAAGRLAPAVMANLRALLAEMETTQSARIMRRSCGWTVPFTPASAKPTPTAGPASSCARSGTTPIVFAVPTRARKRGSAWCLASIRRSWRHWMLAMASEPRTSCAATWRAPAMTCWSAYRAPGARPRSRPAILLSGKAAVMAWPGGEPASEARVPGRDTIRRASAETLLWRSGAMDGPSLIRRRSGSP